MTKKLLAGLVAVTLCAVLYSCTNPENPPENIPENNEQVVVEITTQPLYKTNIKELEDSVSEKETQEIVFTKKTQTLRISALDHNYSEQAKDITSVFSSAEKRADAQASEIKNMAMELVAQGQQGFYFPFCFELSYQQGRNDGAVLSIIEKAYYNSGGPHPYYADFGYNFDAQTGKHLNFEAIFPADFEIEDIIYNKLTEKYPDMIDPQYFSNPSLASVADDSWVFTDDGIDVWFNIYDIAPAAGGTFEISISKDELPEETQKYFIEE